ncbi:hypothetical protein MMC26_006166 [Xylographa opegraphella]|nr:hypothetical protein [Xylographa opegraphella]
MARPKKSDSVLNDSGGQLMSSADIIWMRDNVITGLSNLENGVHELRRTYISYFNSRLPEGHPARVNMPFFPALYPGDNGVARPRAETPGGAADGGAKRKRKPHDPNAPKRALTSYFLFMRDNKPLIKEANPDWSAAQISAESEKRWENITDDDKAEYDHMYQVDLCRYYAQKSAYEAGEPIPDITAEEAIQLYDAQIKSGQPLKGRKAGRPPTATAAPTVLEDIESEPATSDEEEEDTPEPPRVPTPPKADRSSKRQKTAKENEVAKPASSKVIDKPPEQNMQSGFQLADRTLQSPELERKKKGSAKKGVKVDNDVEVDETHAMASSPVKKGHDKKDDKKDKKAKRKRKSEAAGDD